MFGFLSRKSPYAAEPDVVLLSRAEKLAWIARRAAECEAAGRTPVIVAHFLESLDEAAAVVDPTGDGSRFLDARCTPGALARRPAGPCFALADFLGPPTPIDPAAARAGIPPIDILVVERHFLRKHDEALGVFAAALGPGATLRFHIAIDDPLMRLFSGDRTAASLRALGLKEGDSIVHPMIQKSIARAQQKIATRTTAEGSADSAEQWRDRYIRL